MKLMTLAWCCAVGVGACGGTVDEEVGRVAADAGGPGGAFAGAAGTPGGAGGSLSSAGSGGQSAGAGGSAIGGSAGTGGAGGNSGTGGAGGSAGTVSAGSGGSAGSAGAPGVCTALHQSGQTIGLQPEFYLYGEAIERTPALAYTSDDGSTVGLVERVIANGAGNPVNPPSGVLFFVELSPWTLWPSHPIATAAGISTIATVGAAPFVIEQGAYPGEIAIAAPVHSPSSPPSDPDSLVLASRVNASNGALNAATIPLGTCPNPPSYVTQDFSFLRRDGERSVVGLLHEQTGGDSSTYGMGLDDDAACYPDIGCGTMPLAADAVRLPGGGLVVASSTCQPWGQCLNAGVVGLPGQIVFGYNCAPGGCSGALPLTIGPAPSDAVEFVKLAAHPLGFWVTYRYLGLADEVQPPPMAMLVDIGGNVLLNATEIVVPGQEIRGIPAVTSWRDMLVIAAKVDTGVAVGVIDNKGGASWTTVPLAGPGVSVVDGEVSVVAGQDASGIPQVLIAWSQYWSSDAQSGTSAYLAKLICELPD